MSDNDTVVHLARRTALETMAIRNSKPSVVITVTSVGDGNRLAKRASLSWSDDKRYIVCDILPSYRGGCTPRVKLSTKEPTVGVDGLYVPATHNQRDRSARVLLRHLQGPYRTHEVELTVAGQHLDLSHLEDEQQRRTMQLGMMSVDFSDNWMQRVLIAVEIFEFTDFVPATEKGV